MVPDNRHMVCFQMFCKIENLTNKMPCLKKGKSLIVLVSYLVPWPGMALVIPKWKPVLPWASSFFFHCSWLRNNGKIAWDKKEWAVKEHLQGWWYFLHCQTRETLCCYHSKTHISQSSLQYTWPGLLHKSNWELQWNIWNTIVSLEW